MSTKAKPLITEPPPDTPVPEEIHARILRFLERNLNSEAAAFWDTRKNTQDEGIDEELIFVHIDEPEVAASQNRADHIAIAAAATLKVAAFFDELKRQTRDHVVLAIKETVNIDPRWEWKFNPAHQALVKKEAFPEVESADGVQGPDPTNLVEHARIMSRLENDALQAIARGTLPTSWDASASIEWYKDLAQFLLENNDRGRSLVKAICDDPAVAERLAVDEEMPRPVQFLATEAAKTH